jgi:hypothetical protein
MLNACLPAIIAIVALIIAIIWSNQEKRKRHSGSASSLESNTTEISHIQYLLDALDQAKAAGEIDNEPYENIKKKYIARWQELYQAVQPLEEPAQEPSEEHMDKLVTPQPVRPAPTPREPLTLARITRWLLYLGVFLLFIATVIFAVYKWESFPEVVKFMILVVITLSFYAGGWYVADRISRKGGLAFVIVGAIMTVFDGYIYLSAKDLLNSEISWAAALGICGVAYILIAIATRYKTLTYLSCASQAAAIYLVGLHFETVFNHKYETQVFTATLAGAVLLALAWLFISLALKRKTELSDTFKRPLISSSDLLAPLAMIYFTPLVISYFIRDQQIIGVSGLLLSVCFSTLIIIYYTVLYRAKRQPGYIYPVFVAQVFIVASLLAYMKITRYDQIFLALGSLALVWTATVGSMRKWKETEFLKEPLIYSAIGLAGLVSAFLAVYVAAFSIDSGSLRPVATFSLVAVLFVLAVVYVAIAFMEQTSFVFYPGLVLVTGSLAYFLIRVGVDNDYLPLAVVLLSLVFLVCAGPVAGIERFKLAATPLRIYSYILSSVIAVPFAFVALNATLGGDWVYVMRNSTILAYVSLVAFYLTALFLRRRDLLLYPAILFTTYLIQILAHKAGIGEDLAALPVILLAAISLTGFLMGRIFDVKEVKRPALAGVYGLSAYAFILSAPSQPVQMTVLLLSAAYFLVLAFMLVGPSVNVWLGLSAAALAVFIGLDYEGITHLLANVSFIAFYMAIFSISLALKQTGLTKIQSIGRQFFSFSVLYCLIVLALQAFAATAGVFPFWMYAPANGANVMMVAFAVGGFFYITAAYIYEKETLLYAGFLFFLIAYLIKLSDLEVAFIEWYSVPIGAYLITMGYMFKAKHQEYEVTSLSNTLGSLIILGAPTLAYMTIVKAPDVQIHALIAAVFAVIALAAGLMARNKVFFFSGILFLAWNAVYQSWEYVYALPKWITIGLLGLILITSGIYLERRREQFTQMLRDIKDRMISEWS